MNRKSLLYKGDAARACMAVAERPASGINIYNVSAPACTMREIVDGIAAALAVSHPAAAGRVFNVTDGGFHTLNEIIESICTALGRKPPRLSLPVGPTRTLISLIEKGSHAMGIKPPVAKAIIDKYTEDIAVDGSLIQKELGFIPQYDLRTGWEETIKEIPECSFQ